MMKHSRKLIDLLQHFEGVKHFPYKDPAGYWTIGYGHRCEPGNYEEGIDGAHALEILEHDAEIAGQAIEKLVAVPLEQHQYDALVSFVMNIGYGAFDRSDLLAKLNDGDIIGAASEFKRWTYATVRGKKKVLPGLTKRREAERELFVGEEIKEAQ